MLRGEDDGDVGRGGVVDIGHDELCQCVTDREDAFLLVVRQANRVFVVQQIQHVRQLRVRISAWSYNRHRSRWWHRLRPGKFGIRT